MGFATRVTIFLTQEIRFLLLEGRGLQICGNMSLICFSHWRKMLSNQQCYPSFAILNSICICISVVSWLSEDAIVELLFVLSHIEVDV